ncbi:14 kda phosphohistidine [Cystoisospora suis]|uniref:14 kDa phosphohistidine n=1 Tax=Cystoisospora suis TaxID=483139 RepID=A0A2C6KIL9_9APIC|nr:14 kda phosphohistidine [Cystoisospora suis]
MLPLKECQQLALSSALGRQPTSLTLNQVFPVPRLRRAEPARGASACVTASACGTSGVFLELSLFAGRLLHWGSRWVSPYFAFCCAVRPSAFASFFPRPLSAPLLCPPFSVFPGCVLSSRCVLRSRLFPFCGAALLSTFSSRAKKMPSEVSGRHRTPAELQAALKVINDQLADANDVERPALELVAQKLTEELVEVECELAQQQNSEKDKTRPDVSAGCGGDDSQEEMRDDAARKIVGTNRELVQFLTSLPKVRLEEGIQKYVLIKIAPDKNEGKQLETAIFLVRGNSKAEYHYQCALDTMKELEKWGLEAEVQGGGRIECRMTDKQVEIYGHSYQYGRADHARTAQLVKNFFGNDFQVSWGDYGY